MPVEDVAVPKAGKVSEVKGQTPEKSEMDSDYWEKRAKTAVAKRDYLTTEKDIERVTNSPPAPVEQPFKITGGLNLGNIDLQAERAQTLAKLEEIRQASDAKLAALQKTADDYREQVAQIRQESGMAQLNTQIQSLQKQIADGLNSKSKSFIEQWNEINTIVETVGLKKTPVSETLTTPPTVLLELKKMDLDAARAEREFQWKMKQDDRMFAIEMKKLDQGQAINQAKVAAERDRNDLMASIPESIGKAIARGMVDGEKGYNRRA